MSNYENMTLVELHQVWVQNWKALQTGLRNVIPDDEPIPDAQEIAKFYSEIPEDVWCSIFESDDPDNPLRKQLDLQEVIANIQLENVAILKAALKITT